MEISMDGTILVLGATGTVGGRLLARLESRGLDVRAATRSPDNHPPGKTEWILFDLQRPETFAAALDGVTRVFLIARPGDEQADRLALPLLTEMKKRGVRHVVNLTAMGAEVAGHVPALRAVELALEDSGMAFTHLRPNFFMQIFSTGPLLAGIRAGGAIRVPAAGATLSFVDARDIASVAELALTDAAHRGKAYTLTGGAAIDHGQVAAAISQATGTLVRYVPLSEDQARAALGAAGLAADRIERLVRFYRLVRSGACSPVSPDVGAVLGRAPIAFADFVRDHATMWK
jgi:uncharacterized protein YbjT (DUF2867 family)